MPEVTKETDQYADDADDETLFSMKQIGWSLFAVLVVWLLVGFVPWVVQDKPEKAAQFGDSFGFINSLFSAFALAGVVVAILLQSKELREQRKELKLTKRELERSATAQQESQKALGKQSELMFLASFLTAVESVREDAISFIDQEKSATPSYEYMHQRINLRRARDVLDRASRLLEAEVASTIKGWEPLDSTSELGALDLVLACLNPIFLWYHFTNEIYSKNAVSLISEDFKVQDRMGEEQLVHFINASSSICSDLEKAVDNFDKLIKDNPINKFVADHFVDDVKPLLLAAIETIKQQSELNSLFDEIHEHLRKLVQEAETLTAIVEKNGHMHVL